MTIKFQRTLTLKNSQKHETTSMFWRSQNILPFKSAILIIFFRFFLRYNSIEAEIWLSLPFGEKSIVEILNELYEPKIYGKCKI